MVHPRRILCYGYSNVHIGWGMFLMMALFSLASTFQNLNGVNIVILTKLANPDIDKYIVFSLI